LFLLAVRGKREVKRLELSKTNNDNKKQLLNMAKGWQDA
jgi:hypothetical protein